MVNNDEQRLRAFISAELEHSSTVRKIDPPKKLNPKDAFALQQSIADQIACNNAAHQRGIEELRKKGKL
jgi:hypothetical protein